MYAKLRIGIVGCGAIGSSLAKTIISDFFDKARLVSLYDIDTEKAHNLSIRLNKKLAALNLEDLISKADLVIEAAKPDSAFDIARKAILSSKDIMIMSVGGIVKGFKELGILARKKGVHMFIPSGAICGIDGLKASACGKINRVTLTTKKHPKAFLGLPYILHKNIRLDKINEDTAIFEGNASLAIKYFPQNINVAATLSLAGIGLGRTIVRIVASPNITKNIHEIEIESEAGRIVARTENVIHPDNPKTSYLAVLSAVAALKQILEPIKIGT